jgi:hypothetical protein
MKITCPRPECSSHFLSSPKKRPFVRNGSFYRKSDSRWISKFFCNCCKTYFSTATLRADRYQKKRRLNDPIYRLYSSGMTQTATAIFLRVTRKTIARKVRYLGALKTKEQEFFLEKTYLNQPLAQVQFDDLETSEHTKCKPLSVTLAVDPRTRRILKFKVASMPAKGHLAAISFKKYGKREDHRPGSWDELMKELVPYVTKDCEWKSDENPHYPTYLKRHHPEAIHVRKKGGRGASTGQAELKKLRFDPLFSINHTCAMLRARMSRLFRKTWNTTKKPQGLIDHLSIYVSYHNQVLTSAISEV